jgi:hypothetical protein
VPFDFLKRKKDESSGGQSSANIDAVAEGTHRGVPFDGLTEEWRLVGEMQVEGRLSDAVNRREPITLSNVQWAPIDGSEALTDAPGLKSVDPYDLIIVLAGEGSLPPMNESERATYRIHKIPYDVSVLVPPFKVVGTIFLYPGSDPARLLDRATEMFVPVVNATAYLGEKVVGQDITDAILVNRFYLRGVEQIDRRTGERPPTLPGLPLGGTSWQERSR